MALFDPGFTRCALCGDVLPDDDDLVGTTHFIGDPAHPLYRYSDALMHRTCFLRWDRRAAFVAAYNAEMGSVGHYMLPDGRIRERLPGRILGFVIDRIAAVESWLRQGSGGRS